MSKGQQVKRSPSQKVYKSKGPQVRRATSQKVPQLRGPQSKGLQNQMLETKAYKKAIPLQWFTPHVPVFFWPSWHNLRDILLKLLHFFR